MRAGFILPQPWPGGPWDRIGRGALYERESSRGAIRPGVVGSCLLVLILLGGLGVVLAARGEALGKRALKEKDPSLQSLAESNWEEALVHYFRAVDLQPLLQGARYGLGGTLAFLGRYEEALPQLEQAFEADPANFEFARGLAEVQVELGKLHSAARTLESHLILIPTAPYRAHLEATVAEIRGRMRNLQEGAP